MAAFDSETVKLSLAVPEFPSTRVASDTERLGRTGAATSSLVIEPVPEPSAIVAPTGEDSITVNVSSASATLSPLMSTWIICEVVPGANVTVPVEAV